MPGVRTRYAVLVAGLLAVSVGAAAVYIAERPEDLERARDNYPFAYFTELTGTDTVTYGAVSIPNPERADLEVLRVVPNAAHLDVIGVVGVLPAEQEKYGVHHGGPGWPLTEVSVSRPALKTQFRPEDFEHTGSVPRTELQLLIGLRTDGAGLAALNGVTVEYLLDGERITRDFPGAMIVCGGPLRANCSGRDAEADLRALGLLK